MLVVVLQGCVGMSQYHTGRVLQTGKVSIKAGDGKMYVNMETTGGAVSTITPRLSLAVGLPGENEIGIHCVYPSEFQFDLRHQFLEQEKSSINFSGDVGAVSSYFGKYVKYGITGGRKLGRIEPYLSLQRYSLYEGFSHTVSVFDLAFDNSQTSFIAGMSFDITDRFKVIPEYEYKLIDNKGGLATVSMGLSWDIN